MGTEYLGMAEANGRACRGRSLRGGCHDQALRQVAHAVKTPAEAHAGNIRLEKHSLSSKFYFMSTPSMRMNLVKSWEMARLLMLAFIFASPDILSADHMLPVDGRVGGWNSVWQRLVSGMNNPPGHDMAAILVEPPTGFHWMVVIKGERQQCEVYLSQFETRRLHGEPLEKMKVTVSSKALDQRLAAAINQRFVELLLKTRYSSEIGKTAFLDGTHVVVGAATLERPFVYLSGHEIMERNPGVSWVLQVAESLSLYAKGQLPVKNIEALLRK